MRRVPAFIFAASCVVAAGFSDLGVTVPAHAVEIYDLIFKTGTLDDVSRTSALTYQRTVDIRGNEDLGKANSGTISLTFAPDDMAELEFRTGSGHRKIGDFPATVGNPMIMYFVETVVRDMANTAGGSPFYIRNRVKAALVEEAPIEDETMTIDGREVKAQSITLHPFSDDPNRARMKGFEDLSLTITMSEDVPGWYYALTAKAGTANAPVYSNAIVLETTEADR